MTDIVISAPRKVGRVLVFEGKITLNTGDTITLGATVSPETAQAVRAKALDVIDRFRSWAGDHLELTGDWSGVKPLALATELAARAVAAHPVLALPDMSTARDVWKAATDGNREAQRAALQAMASNGPGSVNLHALAHASRLLASPDCNRVADQLRIRCPSDPTAARLLAAVHDYGNCCCGKIHARYVYPFASLDGLLAGTIANSMSRRLTLRALARRATMAEDTIASTMPDVEKIY